MNRIPKAVYTKEFREEAVKLAMTDGRRCIGSRAPTVNIDEVVGELGACREARQAGERWAVSESPDGGRGILVQIAELVEQVGFDRIPH